MVGHRQAVLWLGQQRAGAAKLLGPEIAQKPERRGKYLGTAVHLVGTGIDAPNPVAEVRRPAESLRQGQGLPLGLFPQRLVAALPRKNRQLDGVFIPSLGKMHHVEMPLPQEGRRLQLRVKLIAAQVREGPERLVGKALPQVVPCLLYTSPSPRDI